MASPQLPALFLSHSGEQKGFVWGLYRELLHVNHAPFFDQDPRLDSLPKGSPFPSRILDACRACKLGIVVLSHEYIESKWPMLELQQLLFHNPSSPHNVFPIFYELKPADLCRPENLTRWKSVWDRWHERSGDQHMATLDTDSCLRALKMLRSRNGQIRPENKDDHTFIQTIVSNICTRHPPPKSFLMDDHFKGAKHIQQAMPQVQQFLRQYKVFVILDNVWEWAFRVAKQIAKMDYMPGSKLLVTSRSKNLLQNLSSYGGPGGSPPMQIVHVPSISEEDATEALEAYSSTFLQYINNGEDLRDLARSCFFEKQCHPLLLYDVGAKLRHLGGHIRNTKDWTQLCSRLKSHAIRGGEDTEDIVVNVLKTSNAWVATQILFRSLACKATYMCKHLVLSLNNT